MEVASKIDSRLKKSSSGTFLKYKMRNFVLLYLDHS